MLERFIKPVLAVIAISMLVWIVLWLIFINRQKRKGRRISSQAEMIFFLFYLYIVGVMSLTVIPLPFERFRTAGVDDIHLVPLVSTVKVVLEMFAKYKVYSSPGHTFQNIAGNIILFIPLGIFLPLLFSRYHSLKRVTLTAALCSASIELTQLIIRQFEVYRVVDIDDVILNTLGAVLGFFMVNKLWFNR